MIVLYIFIYGIKLRQTIFFVKFKMIYLGVASNLEKKSLENARKTSSLVGMAGKSNYFHLLQSLCMYFHLR